MSGVGIKQKQLKPCASCGKPLDPRWRVCPYCEAEVPAALRTGADQPRRPRLQEARTEAGKRSAERAAERSATDRRARDRELPPEREATTSQRPPNR